MVRVLHISDLHIREKGLNDLRRIVKAFLEDVRRMHEEVPVDLAVFSGDLAFSGKESEFELAESEFLIPLAEALELARERVVIAIGNHDIDRDAIDAIEESGLTNTLTDSDAVNAFLDGGPETRYLTRMQAAEEFLNRWYGSSEPDSIALARTHRIALPGQAVGVAVLNSAWRATGSAEGGDKRRLLVGARQAELAADRLECDLPIAVMHHPLDWLAEFDENDVRDAVERQFTLILSGHSHLTDPALVVSSRGAAIYSRAGALYESRKYQNSYNVLDIAASAVDVRVRTYFPRRAQFDAGADVAAGGLISLPRLSGSIRPGAALAPYNGVVGGLLEIGQRSSVIGNHLEEISASDLTDLVVPPRLLRVPHNLALASDEAEAKKREDLVGLLEQHHCIVVNGGAESGVSTTLLWALHSRYEVDNERVPAFVDGAILGAGRDPLGSAIRRALQDVGQPLDARAELPPTVVGIDDVPLDDPKVWGRIVEHIKVNPQNRYVLGTHQDAKRVVEALRTDGVESRAVFVAPFGRRELRSLVGKIGPGRPEFADEILEFLYRERLPRTPFMMAVFVAVLSAAGLKMELLSEAVALDRYVQLMLDPWATEDGLDARNYEHILAAFAAHLHGTSTDRISRLDAERFLGAYFHSLGWEASPGRVLDRLISRRVLMEDHEGVAFRHRALAHLFEAKQMLERPEFAETLGADPLANATSIRYATALRRNDRGMLERVGALASESLERAKELVELARFDEMAKDLQGWAQGLDLDQIVSLISPWHEDEDSRQSELDELYDVVEAHEARRAMQTAGETPQSEPSETSDSVVERFPAAIALLSAVLRSSELVDDVELKDRLARLAIEGWALLGVALSAHEDKTESALDLYRTFFGEPDPAAKARILRLFGIVMAESLLVGTMGSPRLAKSVAAILDDDDAMGRSALALFATTLYCEIRGEGWVDRLEDLYDRHGKHPVVSEMVVMHARYEFLHSSLSSDQSDKLRRLLARASVEGAGMTGPNAAKARADVMQKLDRARLRLRSVPGRDAESPSARDFDD